jgi:hypothetical protein
MCIKSYRANSPGELILNKGDIVESMFTCGFDIEKKFV